ncbi:MAG: branched-chain amino acid ABC transporter substrate-binding protein [Cyanobacteria bacterium P01_F01_bin.150]
MTLKIRAYFFHILAALMGIALSGCQATVETLPECTDPLGCVTIAPAGPIKLAALQTLTGDSAFSGVEQSAIIELQLKKRDYKFLDHPVELQTVDELCTPEGGANAALKVIADPQIVAILGTTCSGAAKTASPIMSEAGLVMISSSNTAPSLTSLDGAAGQDWHPGYFRVIYNDAIAGQTAAQFAIDELGIQKAATLEDGSFYAQQLALSFSQAFEKLGGEHVLNTSIAVGGEDMSPFLEAIENSEAEFVFMPILAEPAARILQQVKNFPKISGVYGEKTLFFVSETLISQSFIQDVGEDGIGLYFAGPPPLDNASNDKLSMAYEIEYGEPPSTIFYSFANDATLLLLRAIAKTAVPTEDGGLIIGRQALRDTLYQTDDFNGITGQLKCDEFGDCGVPNFSIVQLTTPDTGVEGLKQNVVYTYTP